MKILVTGGAGFIGSHIVEYLVQRGDSVTVVDNLNTGKIENLKSVFKKINFAQIDIRDFKVLKNLMENIDGIFHQAAMASVQDSFKIPEKFHSNQNLSVDLSVDQKYGNLQTRHSFPAHRMVQLHEQHHQ